MDRGRRTGVGSAFRTPSPEKGADGGRRHSPWTAPRSRKRGKAEYDGRLPGLKEAPIEGSPAERCQDGGGPTAEEQMREHLAQNPFLDPQRRDALCGQEGPAKLAGPGRSTTRTLALDYCEGAQGAGSAQPALWQRGEHSAMGCAPSSSGSEAADAGRGGAVATPHMLPGRGAGELQPVPKENLAPTSLGTRHLAGGLGLLQGGAAAADDRRPQVPGCSSVRSPPAGVDGVHFVSDPASGKLSVQRTPNRGRRLSSVASTPSPDVPAPGIRPDLHGRCPPSVPTSCRTIRRVLIDSPPHSGAPAAGRPASAPEALTEPMSVERLLHEPKAPGRAPAAAAPEAQQTVTHACEDDEPADMDAEAPPPQPRPLTAAGSPRFVLARGHVTPDNLLAGWDEEERPGGPLKGPAGGLSFRRSGELSTFDERLQEAVQNGDVLTLGQAWQGTRRGTLKPHDIDTLNALLKCYCKVHGDPGEAEEIVREACRQGNIKPNSSTYHHMAAIWTSHDQLNN